MKICNCKEKHKKTGVQDESLCYAICDLFCHLKCKAQWFMAILSLLITLCVSFFSDLSYCQLNKITDICLSVFSSTLGLSIATYAIVIGFQSDTLKKLLITDKKEVKLFHIICASMIFNGLLQTFTIMDSFAYQLCNKPTLFYILIFLGSYSIIQILDILLQLLALRTFVANSEQ